MERTLTFCVSEIRAAMGECLYYYTEKQVDPDIQAAVRTEALKFADGPWLYCEPVSFVDREGYEGRLFGWSKLNPFPHDDERRAIEREGGEPLDIQAVVDALCNWSHRYGIDWVIDLDGEMGHIVAGDCDLDAQALVDGLACLRDLDEPLTDSDDLDSDEGSTPE